MFVGGPAAPPVPHSDPVPPVTRGRGVSSSLPLFDSQGLSPADDRFLKPAAVCFEGLAKIY